MKSVLYFLLHVIVLLLVIPATHAAQPGDECGKPSIDTSSESGIFIWKNCATRQWTVVAAGASQSSSAATFKGVISASRVLASARPFNFEKNDSVMQSSDRTRIKFKLNVKSSGRDVFSFIQPKGVKACFNLTGQPANSSVYLGSRKIKIGSSLNLESLSACYNFVFFLMDDMRWNTMWAMPITKKKLATRGVTFSNAFITTPLCCPARANILTGGFYSYNTGVLQVAENIGSEAKFRQHNDKNTIATRLQKAGYRTIFTGGKYLNGYEAPYIPPGWTRFVNNVLGPSLSDWFNFEVVTGGSKHFKSAEGTITTVNQYVTDYHKDRLVDFIRKSGDSPYLAFFSVFAPHGPATPAKQDENRFLHYKYRGRAFGETDLSDKPQWVWNPDRSKHVKSESKIANQGVSPINGDECGKPTIDAATEKGIYIWKNCTTDEWSVMATPGGQAAPQTVFKGVISADQPPTSVSAVGLEQNDSLITSAASARINFEFTLRNSDRDGFEFEYAANSQACFNVADLPDDSPIYLGSNKLPLYSAYNLTTLQPCFDDVFHVKQLQSMQSVDRAIGEIFDEVTAQGQLQNTVFIFMSDNGYLWGEHGLYKKGMAYDEAIRTPLIIVKPGVTKGVEYNMVAADLDVPATILDLAAVNYDTDGDSLVPLLENTKVPWKTELYFQHWGGREGAFGTWSALRNNKFKYVKNALDEIELYDMENDPFELENLRHSPAHQQIIRNMDARLESKRGLAIVSSWRARKGTLGKAYRFQLNAAGGKKPYKWSIAQGQLPAGLTLNPVTGLISGTPTKAGTKKVMFKVEDSSIARHSGNPQYDVRPVNGFYTMTILP